MRQTINFSCPPPFFRKWWMPSVQVWTPPPVTSPMSASGIWPVPSSSQGQSSRPSVCLSSDSLITVIISAWSLTLFWPDCDWPALSFLTRLMSRFWKHLPKDRRRTPVLHFLRACGNPIVWYSAGWSRRPLGYRAEENCCQNRGSLPGQSTFKHR